MPFTAHYEKRHCECCGGDTKHLVTDCYAPDGKEFGSFARCWECPPEQLTAWLTTSDALRQIIVADDQNVAVANRPLAYGSRGHCSADYALTALGFLRTSSWTSVKDMDVCKVQWQ